jgi:hypothetical protein
VQTLRTTRTTGTLSTLRDPRNLGILGTWRTSATILILAYCLLARGELRSSVQSIKSHFSMNSERSDHCGRSAFPTQYYSLRRYEYPQQTRKTSLESEISVSIQKTTITSHDEMVPMDLSCFDCDVRQLDPSATQRSPKNDFFFC